MADQFLSFMAMAKSDVAFNIMFPHAKEEVWVEVIKNRYGSNSRHAFYSLDDAMNFIRDFPKVPRT